MDFHIQNDDVGFRDRGRLPGETIGHNGFEKRNMKEVGITKGFRDAQLVTACKLLQHYHHDVLIGQVSVLTCLM